METELEDIEDIGNLEATANHLFAVAMVRKQCWALVIALKDGYEVIARDGKLVVWEDREDEGDQIEMEDWMKPMTPLPPHPVYDSEPF